jgi:polyisoprenyl-teichoic acid--peptidoglycan teichoic acid transferase
MRNSVEGTRGRGTRGRRADRSLLLLALIVVIAAGAVVYASLQLGVDQITDALKKRQPVNTLLVASDAEKAMFFEVFLYNPETRKATLFHVPANLGGVIESLGKVAGIDALYRRGSPAAVQKKIESLLGVPLHCVLEISLADAARLVDLTGGLTLFIPNPVDLGGPGPGGTAAPSARRVLLPSGSVTLDGDKAIDFLTYEDSLETEVDRTGRQQKFVQALLAALGRNRSLLAQRGPFRLARSLVHASIPPRALASLLQELSRYDAERGILSRVLGTTRTVDGRDLLFPHQDGELLQAAVRQAVAANASSEFIAPEDLTVTVQVLNGTAAAGLANRAREVFRGYDLDVLPPANADSDTYDFTVVYDRKGRMEDARRVADLIRCTRLSTRLDPQGDQGVDVTVILGKDFDGRYCTK